ncbi:hypothetical protein EON64_10340 [archaeon]|nr:MAG: hypothetical protein EON64_10340 [archaeon]
MSFVLSPLPGQRFGALGNPLNIFRRERTIATIGSINGPCVPDGFTTSYTKSEGRITVTWDYDELMSNPVCPLVITPENFGFVSIIDRNKFSLNVDVRTVITSIAVNERILSLRDLEFIPNTNTSFPYTSKTQEVLVVNASNFYDPRYPGMDPITCVTDVGLPNICIVFLGSVIALPVFSHRGFSSLDPIPCDCSQSYMQQSDLDDPNHECNQFSFLTGLIYYDTTDPQALFELVVNQTYAAVQQNAFEQMFIDSAYGLASPNFYNWTTPSYRERVYRYCNREPFGNCSVLMFSSFDLVASDFTVNEFYYQIPTGACRNIFTPERDHW